MHTRRFRLAALVMFCVFSSVGLYTHGGQDDTYITYAAAHALSETGAIVNYNGARVEQSSSLGLVVVLGFLRAVTRVEVPLLGYLFGLVCYASGIVLATRLANRMVGRRAGGWFGVAAATVPCYAYWSTSGMETPLVVATALWSVAALTLAVAGRTATWKHATVAFLALLGFASSRPETPLIGAGLVATAIVWAALQGRTVLRRAAPTLAAAFGGVVVLVGFRFFCFGQLAPNPALVKQRGFDPEAGLRYLLDNAAANNPLLLAALVVGAALCVALCASSILGLRFRNYSVEGASRRPWFRLHQRLREAVPRSSVVATMAILLTSLCAAYVSFVVVSGGDWMKGGRFYALVGPMLALLPAFLIGRTRTLAARRVAVLLVGTHFIGHVQFLRSGNAEGRPLHTARAAVAKVRDRVDDDFDFIELTNKVHARDAVVATHLTAIVQRAYAHLGRPVTIMSGQAGLVMFHTFRRNPGKVRFLDLWNITNQELLDCVGAEHFRYTILGTGADLPGVFAALNERGASCGLGGLPDIYFNERLRPPHVAALAPYDYVVVYHQTGTVRDVAKERWFGSNAVADGHIAVRRALADALGLKPATVWRWDLNP